MHDYNIIPAFSFQIDLQHLITCSGNHLLGTVYYVWYKINHEFIQNTTYHLMIFDYGSLIFVLSVQLPSNFSVASADQSNQQKPIQ